LSQAATEDGALQGACSRADGAGRGPDRRRTREGRKAGGAWSLIKARPVLPLTMLAMAAVSTGHVGIMGWIASFLVRTHDLDLREAGLTVAFISGVWALSASSRRPSDDKQTF
jgi:hypothetical protein